MYNTLENTLLKAVISPTLGGRIISLHSKQFDRSILIPVTATYPDDIQVDKPIIGGGSYALAPYSNRIKNARFIWDGKTHTLPVSPITPPNAIHGSACYAPWEIESQTDTSITCIQQHTANALWGFNFTLRQIFTLDGATLINTLSFTNTDTIHQPIGLGFHPFFSAKDLQTVQISMRGMWQADGNIPICKQDLPAIYDFNSPKSFTHTVDDLFYGVIGPCIANYGAYMVHIDSPSKNAIIYSNDVTKFFCFEPVENITNAHNMQQNTRIIHTDTYDMDYGLIALAPNHTHDFSMRISVTST